MKRTLKYLLYFLAFLLILSICLIEPLDRKPYAELPFYEEMNTRLDSLKKFYQPDILEDSLKIGTARVSITPADTLPLAGYGARKPMEFNEILDSIFVRAIVLESGSQKVALLSADLLIIHPTIRNALYSRMTPQGWRKEQIYFSATHSHSSVGAWADGLAGKIFAGKHDPKQVQFLVDQFEHAILTAASNLTSAEYGYANTEMGMTVKNRLMDQGEEDATFRNVFFQTENGLIEISTYAAHATCFSMRSRALTGDYPSYFHHGLDADENINFSMFMAGAVASMGAEMNGLRDQPGAKYVGENLAEQISLLALLGISTSATTTTEAFKLKVPLRSPQMKISKNLKLRPWLFRKLFGEYEVDIAVFKIGNTLFIGMPCDFSGELALPLYEYAQKRGLNLIITSFNGGYAGYITQDDRYDLEKYETRVMNWYGPDSGAYFSEIVRRIIDTVV